MTQTPPNTPTNNGLDDIDKAAVKTAEYLYGIESDEPIPPELFQVISTLRQLINEEFVHKNKSVSSQFIYDIINPIIKVLIDSRVLATKIEVYESILQQDHVSPTLYVLIDTIVKKLKAKSSK